MTAEQQRQGGLEPSLEGRVAIVTGAGSGIGLEIALRLRSLGAAVVAVDLTLDGPSAAPLEPSDGLVLVTADVTSEADTERAVGVALERFGQVDALANVAGILGVNPPIAEVTPEVVRRTLDVNLIGPTLMLKHAVVSLRASRGAVVNVTSMLAERPSTTGAYYAASKAALEQLSRCWALELGGDGVRVNCVAPGPTDTPVLSNAGLGEERIAEMRRQTADRTPLGRRARPEDIARWIVRFLDPESFATGQSVTVDGGLALT